MVHQFANWFKKLRTHIGVYLAREEVDGLRDYSFMADERSAGAENRAIQAEHELSTSKEWRLLVTNTINSSRDWRDELSRKLANAHAAGELDKDGEREAWLHSEIAASIVYKIIRDALHGYTVEFVRYTNPEDANTYGLVKVDTINFTNRDYRYAFPIRKPLSGRLGGL